MNNRAILIHIFECAYMAVTCTDAESITLSDIIVARGAFPFSHAKGSHLDFSVSKFHPTDYLFSAISYIIFHIFQD